MTAHPHDHRVATLLAIGRVLFAASMLALGVEHFVYQDFVTGRAPPWPFDAQTGIAWAYVSGTLVIICAATIMIGKHGRAAALVLSALILLWAVLRHIPVVASTAVLAPEWTSAVKALAFCGGALLMAATFPEIQTARVTVFSKLINACDGFVLAGTICLALFMINNASQHFIYAEFVAMLIPAWIPGAQHFWPHASAVLLYCGALGMFFPPTARYAALLTGLMVFAWVWLVHAPRFFASVSDAIAMFEAPAIAGIAFVLAAVFYTRRQRVRAGP